MRQGTWYPGEWPLFLHLLASSLFCSSYRKLKKKKSRQKEKNMNNGRLSDDGAAFGRKMIWQQSWCGQRKSVSVITVASSAANHVNPRATATSSIISEPSHLVLQAASDKNKQGSPPLVIHTW